MDWFIWQRLCNAEMSNELPIVSTGGCVVGKPDSVPVSEVALHCQFAAMFEARLRSKLEFCQVVPRP